MGGLGLKRDRENEVDKGQRWGWEDLLEKEMATHSSILTWRILCMEEPGGLQSIGITELTDFPKKVLDLR